MCYLLVWYSTLLKGFYLLLNYVNMALKSDLKSDYKQDFLQDGQDDNLYFCYEVQGVYDRQQVEAVSGELFYYGFYLTF